MYGALEAGGTKMVCAIFDSNANIIKKESFKTLEPKTTMPNMINFFKEYDIKSLGIGCFGPLDLNKQSSSFGTITHTPKIAWRNFDIKTAFEKALNIPVYIDTDVNAAALAEAKLGAAKGLESCVYVTIGTGVGGGVYINGGLVHGLMHPELGHMLIVPHPDDPNSKGICPSHGACLEGLASGPALESKFNISSKELEEDHKAWDIEAYYLAQMCVNLILVLSPQKIILGGGVMQRKHLFKLIHNKVQELLNNYVSKDEVLIDIDKYIVEPSLGTNSGIIGSYLLARS